MKIGLYGGMANNMYVFARALADHGANLCFIRDRSDRYPMSQPVWEDTAFSMAYDEVPRASFWPWSRWTETEVQLNWVAPPWLYDPLVTSTVNGKVTPARPMRAIDSFFFRRYMRVTYRMQALKMMQSCDALLVCGIEGSILANASRRPYIILPHGGDLMIAAGLLKPKLLQTRARILHELQTRQLVTAYANSLCIGVHEPTAFSTDFYGAEHFFRKQKQHFLAVPIPLRKRVSNKGERRQALARLLTKLGFTTPSATYVGFVPSRVDFEWKGHDRLLQAVDRLERERKASDIHLFFSGWGADFDKARVFVAERGLTKRITFLNCALSKPLLYQFFLSADFVVDQFIVGMTGTSALEAMSCGAPLITWVNDAVDRPWGAPPVLQARTVDDIEGVLSDLAAGCLDLEGVGTSLQGWLGRLHDPATVARNLLGAFGGG